MPERQQSQVKAYIGRRLILMDFASAIKICDLRERNFH